MADDPKQLLQSFLGDWREAFNRGDASGVAALYTTEAYYSGAMAGNCVGRDQIGRALDQLIKGGLKMEGTVSQARMISTDVAVGLGEFSFAASDGGTASLKGHWGATYLRDGGEWRCVLHVTNRPAT